MFSLFSCPNGTYYVSANRQEGTDSAQNIRSSALLSFCGEGYVDLKNNNNINSRC